MKLKNLFLASAIIPIFLAGIAYYVLKQDNLGGKTLIRGAYEDIDIYTMDYGV